MGAAAQPSPAQLHNCWDGCWAVPFPPSVLIYVQESPGPHGPPSLHSTAQETKVWGTASTALPGLTEDRPPLTLSPQLPQKDNFISSSGFQESDLSGCEVSLPSAVLDPCYSAPSNHRGSPSPRVFFSSRLQNKKSRSKAQGQSENLALLAPWSDMGSGRGTAKALMGTVRSLGRNNCPGVSSAPRAGFPWLHQLNPPSAMPAHGTGRVTPTPAALQGSSRSTLAQGPILHLQSTQNSLQLKCFPCSGKKAGHWGRLCSFALSVRPQTPRAGIQHREVTPRARILLRAVCKHLGFLY